jgi:hydroxyacylglutathione hydrolase
MIQRQFLHTAPIGISYLFGCGGKAEVLTLGNVAATVWHTPCHTPKHLCMLVSNGTRAAEPWFVLTGHTLMVGDLGRTELAASAEDGARAMFASVQRLKGLPDYVEVLPGAFSGSICGRRLSGKPSSTIGFERRYNQAFAMHDEDEFVRAMLRDVPRSPVDAARIRAVNAGLAVAT